MIPASKQPKPTESTKAERAEFFREWMSLVVKAAKEASENHGYVRLLDIATGGNGVNADIIKTLVSNNIRYQLTLSDISPVIFKKGYETLQKRLPAEELNNVICILADSTDLRKDLEKIIMWGHWRKKHLKEVLRMPEYDFLNTGYVNGHRLVHFQDESFDIVTGVGAYSNIMPGTPDQFLPAIRESHRVLRTGGYHIVYDGQVEVINTKQPRTHQAMERAKIRTLDILIEQISQVFGSEPEKVLPIFRYYDGKGESKDQTTQYDDYRKDSMVVHRKK